MKLSIVTIALLSTLSATASAEGFFWGAAVGQSYSNLCPPNGGPYSCTTTGDAFVVSAGYSFTPNFSIEADYQILGTIAAYDSSNTGGAATSSTKANAVVVAATENLEITKNLSFLGKLGIAGISIDQPTLSSTNTASNTNFVYGLGLQYDFTKGVAGRALWENLGSVGDASTSQSRMSLLSMGLIFKY